MKQLIDEETLRVINEELGVADEMSGRAIKIMQWLGPKLVDLQQKSTKVDTGITTINMTAKSNINLLDNVIIEFRIIFADNRKNLWNYLEKQQIDSSEYQEDNNKIILYVTVVAGYLDYNNACETLQHELCHAYQAHRKADNDVEMKSNTKRNLLAKQNINNDNKYDSAVARVIYLYGTNEITAYENGLYSRLLSYYQYHGFSEYTEQQIIASNKLYILVKTVDLFLKDLENNAVPNLQNLLNDYGLTLSELRKMCYTVQNRGRRCIARAALKSRLDYKKNRDKSFVQENIKIKNIKW